MSLEQAYVLLLNNQHDDMSLEKYFIYSNLSKAGYIVQPHRRHINVNRGGNNNSNQRGWSKDITLADKCVWRCFYEDLKQPRKQPTSSQDISQEVDELYAKVKQNMKNIEDAIKSQRSLRLNDNGSSDESDNWQIAIDKVKTRRECSRKRKLESIPVPSTSKKISKSDLQPTDRFLDVLTYEQDVCSFRKIFDEIQVIQLDRSCDNVEGSNASDLEFDFDLYAAQPGFKQSDPGPPNFRILIFKSNKPPPTRKLIVKAFLKPTIPAPVLVFYVNELMRVSAFLYRISL